MSYNSSAQMMITNNTEGNATITLSHRYSDDPVETKQFPAKPGETVGPLDVGFNTGFGHFGLDYWYCEVDVTSGANAGVYKCEGAADYPKKECELKSEDNGKILTSSVNTTTFLIALLSGTCTTSMSRS